MVMPTTSFKNVIDTDRKPDSQAKFTHSSSSSIQEQPSLLQGVIEDLIDGILVLTTQKELIYANDSAHRVLRRLNQDNSRDNLVPNEIWHICQYLIQSRSLFPNQHWLIESEIFTDNSNLLHIRARWLKLESMENSCLLLTVEDKDKAIKKIALEEAKQYGMTPRETEVWGLHRSHYTYKEIASQLCITPNTVKKHMRSIHAKQKNTYDCEE